MTDNMIPIAIIFAIGVAVIMGADAGINYMERQAVEHNASYYDTRTKEFKWNQEVIKQ